MIHIDKFKSIYLIPLILVSFITSIKAQKYIPEGISYQAIIRNNSGIPISNQNVVVNVEILSNSKILEWKEFHSVSTNAFGLVTLVIGKGTNTQQGNSKNFFDIPWGSGNISIQISANYGQGETALGTIGLQSVPYAIVAHKVLYVDYNDIINKPDLTSYIKDETDPIYSRSVAANIKASDTLRWSKPSSFTGDYYDLLNLPNFASVATSGDYSDLINKPNLSAFLTSEVDPLFSASVASKIDATDTAKWSLKSSFSGSFIDLTNKPTTLDGYGITDAMSTLHTANSITSTNIANWNAAYGWGNHTGLYRPITYVPSWNEITSNPFSVSSPSNNQMLRYNSSSGKWENFTPNFLSNFSESDPLWSNVSGNYYTKTNMKTSGEAQLHFNNITSKPTTLAGYGIVDAMSTSHAANAITSANISNWTTAYNWGNHANAGYLKSYTETDPLFTASAASGITATNIAQWNSKSNFSGDYNDLTNKPVGQNVGDMLYWDGVKWVNVPVGSNTQTLTISNGIPTWLDPATTTPTSAPQVITGDANVWYSTTSNTIGAGISSSIAISTGNSKVIARGICWNTANNPTINNNRTFDGSGLGSFSSSIEGLSQNIRYYARAYITTEANTYYGNEITFIADGIIQIVTQSINNIGSTKATANSLIICQGGLSITEQGFCLSINTQPTVSNSKYTTSNGYAEITGLSPNTTYYIRAYATNSTGTYYGNELTFTTGNPIVTLTTSSVSTIKSTYADVSAVITDDGGNTVTSRGICWGTNSNPDINGSHIQNGNNIGDYNTLISGLTPHTKYYARAYATNSTGTYYGNELTFTTADPVVTFTNPQIYEWDLTCVSATIRSAITDDGGNAIAAQGVCWATTHNPTTANNYKEYSTLGYFNYSVTIDGLVANSIYYVRSYVIAGGVTYYSNESAFTTKDGSLVVSTQITENNGTSALGNGSVSDNGTTITERGFCWATTRNPDINNSKISAGIGAGSFSATITGLSYSSTYYVRAYATNSVGTFYGNEVTLVTGNGVVAIATDSISAVTANTATGYANITSLGGIALTGKGVCWSTNQNPTINDSKKASPTYDLNAGNYALAITNLEPNKTYYVRAYAINSKDTYYGNQLSFTTRSGAVSITTLAINNIGSSTANSGGTITTDGGAGISDKGVCWSTSPNPTISSTVKSCGSGTSNFSASLTNLNANTTYYLRAYAINSVGVWYGNELTFTTLYGNVLFNSSVVSTGSTIAQISVAITDGGGVTLDEKGICWGTSENPTIANSNASYGSGTDAYYPKLTGLTANTTYYARPYAINSLGTWYGNQLSFTTSSNPDLTDIDGNKYLTVTIGTQTWMAENLKVTHYQNGEEIPIVTDNTLWANLSTGARCFYYNDEVNYGNYGAYYNFYAVTDSRNLCPTGWHVPSYNEWNALKNYVGNGASLLMGGNSGINLLLSGYRREYGDYSEINFKGYYWSSTLYNAANGYNVDFYSNYWYLRQTDFKAGQTVRCIKD